MKLHAAPAPAVFAVEIRSNAARLRHVKVGIQLGMLTVGQTRWLSNPLIPGEFGSNILVIDWFMFDIVSLTTYFRSKIVVGPLR